MRRLLFGMLAVVMMLSLTACSKPTMEEFAASDEIQSEIEDLRESLAADGMDLTITGEGNRLIYTYTMPAELAVDGVAEALASSTESQASTFEDLAAQLKGAVDAENPVVVVTYVTSDGTELYSQEFSAAE